MTPLWFWEPTIGLVQSDTTHHSWIYTENGAYFYFDGQLVGSFVNEPIYDAGEFVIAWKDQT